MRFHNRAIDQIQTVARFCRQSIENMLPDSSPRPAVEPIVRTRVRAVAFGQIAPRDPGPQHVKYCIYDPSIVRARALPTLRHQRLENRPFLIAEIESHDPPPPAVNHDPCCFSVNYAGTDPNLYNQHPQWLSDAHRDLDAVVAAAYGWPADISEDGALSKLLELNQARAGTSFVEAPAEDSNDADGTNGADRGAIKLGVE